MTTNFQEKQRWVASLEAVVKSAQCKSDLYRNVITTKLDILNAIHIFLCIAFFEKTEISLRIYFSMHLVLVISVLTN